MLNKDCKLDYTQCLTVVSEQVQESFLEENEHYFVQKKFHTLWQVYEDQIQCYNLTAEL